MQTPDINAVHHAELEAEKEASWATWGPNSEGVRGLLFARGHVWEIDGIDWNFQVTAVWTPEAFVAEFQTASGPWGDVVAWLQTRAAQSTAETES